MAGDLRLVLRKDALEFADGPPFCLVCGMAPAGTHRVRLVEARKPGAEPMAFDAPLCQPHLARARIPTIVVPFLAISGVAILGLGLVFGDRLPVTGWLRTYLPFMVAVPDFLVAFVLWSRKDRGGLPCAVERLPGDGLLLSYPGEAPARR